MTVAQRFVDDFREQGFTHVPGLLTAAEVDRYRAAAAEAIARQSRSPGKSGGRGGLRSTVDAWWDHEVLRELAGHPGIGAVAEHLAGMPLRIWGGEAYVKPPHDGAPTILHDDLTFLPLDGRLSLNAWTALVDVPVERGALTFLPRSHDRPGPLRGQPTGAGTIPHSYLLDQWPDLRWSPRVTVPLRAGDVTFHQSRLGHLGNGNTSDGIRVAFITTYTDAAATYRSLAGFNRRYLVAGRTLPDDRYPLVGDGSARADRTAPAERG